MQKWLNQKNSVQQQYLYKFSALFRFIFPRFAAGFDEIKGIRKWIY